jgi:nucleotide-binding universal stress UspA family protein
MKTIIVTTDFSPVAENAATYAAEMASVLSASVLLLHVYEIPLIQLEVPFANNEEEIKKSAEKKLSELQEKLLLKTGGKIEIDAEIRTGIFFQELQALCNTIDPYAVVMGSQATSFAEKSLYGRRTVYAMKKLKYPLIAVPPGVKFSSIKKIGLACDLRKVTDTIPAEEIILLVHELNADLHILNIDRLDVFNPKTDYDSVLLEKMLAALKPTYHFITNGNTDQAIIDFAEENKLDLLIVVPKRRGLLKRLFHKSHTKQLVLHAHVPVMAMHQQLDV